MSTSAATPVWHRWAVAQAVLLWLAVAAIVTLVVVAMIGLVTLAGQRGSTAEFGRAVAPVYAVAGAALALWLGVLAVRTVRNARTARQSGNLRPLTRTSVIVGILAAISAIVCVALPPLLVVLPLPVLSVAVVVGILVTARAATRAAEQDAA